jgi:virulence-associated protein VagC
MKIAKTTVIRRGDEQILELPEDMAFPDDVQEVEIFKQGASIVIVPRGNDFSESSSRASENFLNKRD